VSAASASTILSGHARDPGARADIQDPPRVGRQQPHEQQAVEHDAIDDPVGIGGADETLATLPFQQQFQILIEQIGFWLGEGPAQDRGGASAERLRRESRS